MGWLAGAVSSGPRTLLVSASGSGPPSFQTIAAAMAAARPGDVVQLEAGRYAEQVIVKPGVDLVARTPGTAELVRSPNAPAPWIGITARGVLGGRIYGIKILSTAALPMDAGLSISGHNWTIEAIEVDGNAAAGVDIMSAADVTMRDSVFDGVRGPAVRAAERSSITLAHNMFLRRTGTGPAVSVHPTVQTALTRNVFVGYGADFVQGLPPDQRTDALLKNFVISAPPSSDR
jgi:hypothetical protein